MKKIIILSIAVLFLITSCSSETVVEEPTKPSEINTFNETIKDNYVIIEGEKYKIEETMKEIFYYKKGSEQLEKKIYEANTDDISFKYIETYEYENDLLMKEKYSTQNGEMISETHYTYDDQQRVVESRAVLQANDKEIVKKYTYGMNTKTLFDYLPDDKFLRKVITYYDDNNQMTKRESYNIEDQLTSVTNMTSVDEYITKEVSKEDGKIVAKRYKEKNNMDDVIKFLAIVSLDQDEPHTTFLLVDNVYDDNMRLIKKIQYTISDQIDADILERLYFEKNNK